MKNLRENNSIFITGASGFLGKNFLNFLSKKKNSKIFIAYLESKKKILKILNGLKVI